MIIRGVRQEQKTPILFSLPVEMNVGKPDPADTIFKREYDLSKIDYVFYYAQGKLEGVNGTGYIKLYIGGTLKNTCTIPNAAPVISYEIIDCTALTGLNDIELTIQLASPGVDDLIISALYIGMVDA